MFSRVQPTNFNTLYWTTLPDQRGQVNIQADFLNDKRFVSIGIDVPLQEFDQIPMKIDPLAFRSSRNVTQEFSIFSGDWTEQADFSFLNGFVQLTRLMVSFAVNLPGVQTLPASLPELDLLQM